MSERLPAGLKRFAVTSSPHRNPDRLYHVLADGWRTVASNEDAAWAKFLRQFCPSGCIPARADYVIGHPASVEIHDASARVLFGAGYDLNGERKAKG